MSISAGGGPPRAPGVGDAVSDSLLVEQVRAGDLDSYLHLWDRHVESARAVASTAQVSAGETESVVNRAFSRVLGQITIALDPMGPFRPYLFRMLHEELGVREGDALPPTNVLQACCRLSVRVQTVLWYSVVEEVDPPGVAALMGEDVEEVIALLTQSIALLRAEWLVELICDPALTDACAWLVQRADARARGELGEVSARRFDAHLSRCEDCTRFLATLGAFPEVLRDAFRPLFSVNRRTPNPPGL